MSPRKLKKKVSRNNARHSSGHNTVELLVRPNAVPALRRVFPRGTFRTEAKRLLRALGCTSTELSVLITGDDEIHNLNACYRGKDKPTDVLSFPSAASANSRIIGDVVISLDTAKRQAKELRVTLRSELLRLLVHGTLHLLGYEHEKVSRATADKMRAKEDEMLALLLRVRPSSR